MSTRIYVPPPRIPRQQYSKSVVYAWAFLVGFLIFVGWLWERRGHR